MDDRALLYYKLNLSAFGSGELINVNKTALWNSQQYITDGLKAG